MNDLIQSRWFSIALLSAEEIIAIAIFCFTYLLISGGGRRLH